MKSKFFSANADFAGFLASMLCAIHCAALPFVLTIGALSNLAWLEHGVIDLVFIFLSIIIASWSLVRSYLHHHRSLQAIVVVAAGFAVIIGSRFATHDWEHWLTMIGGILIAGAHLINWRLLAKHDAFHSASCDHTAEEGHSIASKAKILQHDTEKVGA